MIGAARKNPVVDRARQRNFAFVDARIGNVKKPRNVFIRKHGCFLSENGLADQLARCAICLASSTSAFETVEAISSMVLY